MGNEGRVVAVEADRRRAEELERNCKRLGVECVEVVVGDAAQPVFGGDFDIVLVDPRALTSARFSRGPTCAGGRTRPR